MFEAVYPCLEGALWIDLLKVSSASGLSCQALSFFTTCRLARRTSFRHRPPLATVHDCNRFQASSACRLQRFSVLDPQSFLLLVRNPRPHSHQAAVCPNQKVELPGDPHLDPSTPKLRFMRPQLQVTRSGTNPRRRIESLISSRKGYCVAATKPTLTCRPFCHRSLKRSWELLTQRSTHADALQV